MRASICVILAMTLSACGGAAPETPDPKPADDAAPPVAEQATGEEPETVADSADLVPARFHGAWDYEGGTCDAASDMRMEVSGDEILFYESMGTVTETEIEGGDVVLTLDMEGEGETWTQHTRFSLVGEGEALRLHVSDGEAAKEMDDYPSMKCSA